MFERFNHCINLFASNQHGIFIMYGWKKLCLITLHFIVSICICNLAGRNWIEFRKNVHISFVNGSLFLRERIYIHCLLWHIQSKAFWDACYWHLSKKYVKFCKAPVTYARSGLTNKLRSGKFLDFSDHRSLHLRIVLGTRFFDLLKKYSFRLIFIWLIWYGLIGISPHFGRNRNISSVTS